MTSAPLIIHHGVCEIEVCVPSYWADHMVIVWANANEPSGTQAGWKIRRGASERVSDLRRPGCVHITLET